MKVMKTLTVISLSIIPFIIILVDWIVGNSRVISVIEWIFSPYFPGDYNSTRYALSAIIQSVATILTLVFTISLISLQLVYKHARITRLFLGRRETKLLLFFMFLVIIFSTLVLSSIENESNLTGTCYFFAVYSIFLFIFPLPLFIYDYWRFCGKFFNSRDLLRIIREEESQDIGILSEILKKAQEEDNIDAVKDVLCYFEHIYEQIYSEHLNNQRVIV